MNEGTKLRWFMRVIRSRSALFTLGLLAFCSSAQESQPPAQSPPPAAQAPAPPAQSSTPPAQSVPRVSPEVSDDVFIPTEELSADEEVTFPVDI